MQKKKVKAYRFSLLQCKVVEMQKNKHTQTKKKGFLLEIVVTMIEPDHFPVPTRLTALALSVKVNPLPNPEIIISLRSFKNNGRACTLYVLLNFDPSFWWATRNWYSVARSVGPTSMKNTVKPSDSMFFTSMSVGTSFGRSTKEMKMI